MTVTNHGPDEVGWVAMTDPIPGGGALVCGVPPRDPPGRGQRHRHRGGARAGSRYVA